MGKITRGIAAKHRAIALRKLADGAYASPAHKQHLEDELAFRERILLRDHACFECGRQITNPDALLLWQKDHLGSECRRKQQAS